MYSFGQKYLENIRNRHLLAKNANVAIKGTFDAKAQVDTDNGNRDIVITATSDSIDLVGDVVVQSGIDAAYFNKNRRIFTEHWTAIEKWAGSLRYIRPLPSPGEKHKRTEIRVRMLDTPLGNDILTLARIHGVGASIGFDVLDWGTPTPEEIQKYSVDGIAPTRIIRSCRWLETSFVGMPCNIDCVTAGEVIDEQRAAQLDELVTKNLIRRESAVALGLREAAKRSVSISGRRNLVDSGRKVIIVDLG